MKVTSANISARTISTAMSGFFDLFFFISSVTALRGYDIAFVRACLILYNLGMTDEEIRKELQKKKRKQRVTRRLIACFVVLALTVAAGCLAGRALGNRKYEKELSKYVSVTADMPIIEVAKKELGNQGGEKFWTWYGFSMRVDWCAIFVSWCEDQCGYIDESKAPSFAMVSDGGNWFVRNDQWLDKGSVPEPGDLIFFDWEKDGDRDHVGIVTQVIGDKVFTIEGNSSDRCRQKRYSLDNPMIYGYGQ
ncbi:MAG: CHAP domain-containing protein, partial [Clostridiales bacterium]|nr:CHAP domain-containing protein [Clostridiales bacterium]